ncbi:PrsW family glutamic-type intramembrane protease [Vallitalea guaymasensis]|uniref:PrsW family glutamic-type intramembrane protease n=1 Tax=Vallitalea guaymasensis TaxID=1185412 RepID=UPI000DE3AB3A|nr:PrsW family glutamic-type intramembrane protease [Vallitalea guaymasensis]
MDIDLYVVAITPGIALALGIYLTDRYDKEPLHLLIKIFIFGGISILPVILIERILAYFNIFTGLLGIAYVAFIVAGFTEEFVKRVVVKSFAYNHRAFNEKLDGIVYAVFASLGFATVENVLYVVFRYSNVATIGLQRAIFSVPAHMLFAITMGYYLSLAKFGESERQRKYYLRLSLWIPVLLHGLYDYILMSKSSNLFIIFIPFVIFLWSYNLRKLNRYYKESKAMYMNNNDEFD